MIITGVQAQYPSQMALVPHNHMIETLPSDRSDQPFYQCSLPRTGCSSPDFFDPHCPHSICEISAISFVLIPQQIQWSGILRKSLNHLLPCPRRGRK
jgi:hypothetical protein